MNQPLTEKYRPRLLSEMVGNEEVVHALELVSRAGTIPHMLFYGPPGTGKTTAIRAMTSHLPRLSVLELNASDERGIGTVRETIKEFASTYSKTVKIVILDEADMMSRDAQNALRRIIEDFSRNTRFCLIANYSKKIIPAILSRCTKFRFSPVANIRDRLREVCRKEGIQCTEDGIQAVADTSDGDVRKAVNDIQGISASFGLINEQNTLQFNSLAPRSAYQEIFQVLQSASISDIRARLQDFSVRYESDCDSLIRSLADLTRQSGMRSRMRILKDLSDIEYRRAIGCSESIQLSAVAATFVLNRD